MYPAPPPHLDLNRRGLAIAEEMILERERLRIGIIRVEGGGRVLDAGVKEAGGVEAGLYLARICLAGLGRVSVVPGDVPHPAFHRVQVETDRPVTACMASQYAGWKIAAGKFFAMGSGPMRAAYGGEELFQAIGRREIAESAVGVLESSTIPGEEVFRYLASKTCVEPSRITVAVAACRSIAGTIQVVARSVETALHKLHSIGFDITRVESGVGSAPIPPPARDELGSVGRTNDAVLYGGRVTLWVHGDDESLAAAGKKVPSSSSPEHGEPFARIFERHGGDFYKIDPGLFSPAEVTLHNMDTGRTHRFGRLEPEVLEASFRG